MTRKERKELARKIVKYETMIQKSESDKTIEFAKEKLNELIMSTDFNLEDMAYIDDLVRKSLT